MKLYCDPISTTSRPVLLFAAEHELPLEIVHVDLMAGGHQDPAYLALNPNGVVPFLVDGDFALGESAAILKYLARKTGSGAYPTDLQARARVDEAISWFSCQFHEVFCMMVCYPNMGVPKGMDPALLQGLKAYGAEHAPRWLAVLDRHMLGARPYVAGEEITLADYLGVSYVLLGELAGFDFEPYPNIRGWIARMQARPHFAEVFERFFGMAAFFRQPAQAA
ncbi:glutathione S-transferase family protein [Phenylobacterium sp. J426]|uniref:glutathione S-transferase family protein n=1 Tax=Phenylobacterium sp. J426 TaxID=2898439 RepID=UPI0021511BC9|nr:glutathione S-transferase family protein [Phenylobacterium sp. J426]MCR5874032.1 glutathione S-transferase family protein [Phenylobacterium sp. J426]